MNRIYLLTAMLCLSMFFSCTEVERDNCYDEKSINYKKCFSDVPSSSNSSCDISGYKTVQIGNQFWMAENLNCYVEGSVCYDNSPANCRKYGRLYDWEAANIVCPKGWHLPSYDEWQELVDFAGGHDIAGKYLKTSVWGGDDRHGFSALPGGYGYSDGSFSNVGDIGGWWSVCNGMCTASFAYDLDMYQSNAIVIYWTPSNKSAFLYVRCVQD
ncbi:MAG: hypothetical protein LBC75_02070 [Fibromonadaceae bacterium]|jgi:uncharacterized protein (TIGR02145 family)|nr:hypothetical protein [Fibromonadaceae bacterium]